MTKSAVWLGDLARALAVAPPDDAARKAVARALGFELGSTAGDVNQELGDHRPQERPPPAPPNPVATSQDARAPSAAPFTLQPSGIDPPPPPLSFDDSVAALAPLEAQAPTSYPDDGLLVRQWTSAIVSRASSIRTPEGAIHEARLVDEIARGRPLARVPRWPVWTTRWGVDVLVDEGEGLAPFLRDVQDLVRTFQSVVGRSRARVQFFTRTPDDVEFGIAGGLAPVDGAPIVLLTDFGLSRTPDGSTRGSRGAWLRFIRSVRGRGGRVVAFVPLSPHRIPLALRRAAVCIDWDRSTTAGHVAARLAGTRTRRT